MFHVVIASLRGNKRRALATCSAVLLGVMFLAGTLVLGDTMRSGFGSMFDEANDGTDAVVRSDSSVEAGEWQESSPIQADTLDTVRAVPGVGGAAPVIEADGQLVGSDGSSVGGGGPPTLAGNWVPDENLNAYQIADGRAPEAAADGEPHEVVIDRASADDGDLAVGDSTVVRVPEPVDVTVVGIATFGEQDGMGGTTWTAFTTEVAQELLMADPGMLSSVAVSATAGVEQDELVRQLGPTLPDGVEAITGAQLVTEMESDIESGFIGFFETVLLLFAGIALVVATFSIYNTFAIVVAQRTQESALLRSLGASRRQLLSSVVAEAAVIGMLASALGLAAGAGLARAMVALFDSAGMDLPTSTMVFEPASLLTALVVGVVVTLIAGVAPARRASRVAPIAALREAAVDRSDSSRGRAVVGAVAMVLGAPGAAIGAMAGDLALTGLSALALILGVVLFGPVMARPAAALLGTPFARMRGVSGVLARANAMRNPSRTASTATALMIGVAVVGMIATLGASLTAYMDETVDESFHGDLALMQDGFSGVGFGIDLQRDIAGLPEVESAASLGMTLARVDGEDTLVDATDGPALSGLMDIDTQQGSLDDLVGDDTLAISAAYAEDEDLSLGDSVPFEFANGTAVDMEVVTVYGARDLTGNLLIPEQAWLDNTSQPTAGVMLIGLADGVDLETGRSAIQPLADAQGGGVDVQDNQEFVDANKADIEQMLSIIYVMLTLAVIIALMSIANTLSLSTHERIRELGLLRAVGQTRSQMRSMVRGEAIVVSLFGTVTGIALGAGLGWVLTRAVVEDEGFSFVFELPLEQYGLVFLLGGLVGLLASVLPARRAARAANPLNL